MGFFDLPQNWVYVTFSNGKIDNVANQDTLDQKDADWFRDYWQSPSKKVVKVELKTASGRVLKTYNY